MASAIKQPITVHHRHANGTLGVHERYAPGTVVGERLAYAYGDLATGTTVYACHDQLGSVRRWRTPSKLKSECVGLCGDASMEVKDMLLGILQDEIS